MTRSIFLFVFAFLLIGSFLLGTIEGAFAETTKWDGEYSAEVVVVPLSGNCGDIPAEINIVIQNGIISGNISSNHAKETIQGSSF